jgi:hypothetical protein
MEIINSPSNFLSEFNEQTSGSINIETRVKIYVNEKDKPGNSRLHSGQNISRFPKYQRLEYNNSATYFVSI